MLAHSTHPGRGDDPQPRDSAAFADWALRQSVSVGSRARLAALGKIATPGPLALRMPTAPPPARSGPPGP
jgi:hypothetical protein